MSVQYPDLDSCDLDQVRDILWRRPRFLKHRGQRFDLRTLVDSEDGAVFGWEVSRGGSVVGVALSAADLLKQLERL